MSDKQENKVLQLIQSHYPEYHPLVSIAHIAHKKAHDDPRLELDCHKTIAKYVEQELKSIEVSGHIDHEINTLRVIIDNRQAPPIEGEATRIEHLEAISFDSFLPTRLEESETVRQDRDPDTD